MTFKNFFFLKTLIKYNLSKNKIFLSNFIKYNYKFFLKPVSSYLLINSYYFWNLYSTPILDRFELHNNTYIDISSINFFEKNFLILIF